MPVSDTSRHTSGPSRRQALTVRTESDGPDPRGLAAWADEEALDHILDNLLDNALKYTPAGNVHLRVTSDRAAVQLEVADSGPGIPEDRRDVVFDRFVRLEGSRSTPGNGLGLSLVRAVALLHGGTVGLGENHPGLRAILTLPPLAAS